MIHLVLNHAQFHVCYLRHRTAHQHLERHHLRRQESSAQYYLSCSHHIPVVVHLLQIHYRIHFHFHFHQLDLIHHHCYQIHRLLRCLPWFKLSEADELRENPLPQVRNKHDHLLANFDNCLNLDHIHYELLLKFLSQNFVTAYYLNLLH